MVKFNEVRDRFYARLKTCAAESRVFNEAGDLVGQSLAGTILKPLLQICAHLFFITVAAVAVDFILTRLLHMGACAAECFARPAYIKPLDPATVCCPWDLSVIARAIAGAIILAVGSYSSTRIVHTHKFQNSAILTTGMILVVVLGLRYLSFPWWFGALLVVGVFFSMFAGYRLALRNKKRTLLYPFT
ncbi:MAG: hypothetical protein GX589_02865 [Deltaproteobacteria bacterium]|nr:hypothetical protein [Deltaproteobacteria bacterium]